MTSIQQERIAGAGCEVRFDNLTRQLYATDASIYQIEPAGVAFPRDAQQASAVIRAAAEEDVPITPRGAGTSLVGNAIGNGLILDFSRHNRRISDLDVQKRSVRVGAGVVLDQLNNFLKPHGFCFGPDVATSARATLGGMIANNSSGARVPVYGTTADHVLATEIVLADGRTLNVGPRHETMQAERDSIASLVRANADEMAARWPPGLLKRWPGYGIERFSRATTNLNEILAGSEGTLAAIFSAELKISPLPREKGVGLIFFASVAEAMQATVELLDLKPAAIEHIDRPLFDQTKGQRYFQPARDLLELDARPCEAILIVEFYENVADRLSTLESRKLGLRSRICRNEMEMDLVWSVRKAGLSLVTGRVGTAKPVAFIEDAAVRPAQLPEYVRGLQSIMRPLGLEASYYGHAASGLLHVRPVLDLHRADDLKKFRQVADQTSALVRQFKGSLSAEHGVGIARTEYMREQLGDRLLALMREIKRAFDPKNIFNPGKIFEPESAHRADRRPQPVPAVLRLPAVATALQAGDSDAGAGVSSKVDARLRDNFSQPITLPFAPRLAFAFKDRSFVGNLEQCNGCGGCRKETGIMCPTFMATGDELMSTRGRANIIRWALGLGGRGDVRALESGNMPPHSTDSLKSAELDAALSNCLSCKGCTPECPSNVNLALLKAEMLYARHQRDGLPLRERIFSNVDLLGRMGCAMPSIANAVLDFQLARRLMEKTLGISAKRSLPHYTKVRFDRWFKKHAMEGPALSGPGRDGARPSRGSVILWDDTFVRYHEPHIGIAATKVLERIGFEVSLVASRKCCGRPAFSQGNLDAAAKAGQHNLSLLSSLNNASPARTSNTPIVFLEPSCWSMFVEDYRELKLEGAEEIAGRCFLFEKFIDDLLAREPDALAFQAAKPLNRNVAIHAHCHAKSIENPDYMARLARRLPGRTVELLDTGCCGMAGVFGALADKYELSLRVAADLIGKIERQPAGTAIVASGTSCRHQIADLTKKRAKHMAELIAEAIGD